MGNEGVIAVEKALALLDCFTPGEETMTLTVLAQLSGYHKTTVYRLMNSLERMNYVIRRDNSVYTLGPRLLYLSKLYEQSFHLSSMFSLRFMHWLPQRVKVLRGMLLKVKRDFACSGRNPLKVCVKRGYQALLCRWIILR